MRIFGGKIGIVSDLVLSQFILVTSFCHLPPQRGKFLPDLFNECFTPDGNSLSPLRFSRMHPVMIEGVLHQLPVFPAKLLDEVVEKKWTQT